MHLDVHTSGFQNCELIHFCCFKAPSLFYLFVAAPGSQRHRGVTGIAGPGLHGVLGRADGLPAGASSLSVSLSSGPALVPIGLCPHGLSV